MSLKKVETTTYTDGSKKQTVTEETKLQPEEMDPTDPDKLIPANPTYVKVKRSVPVPAEEVVEVTEVIDE